MLPIQRPDTEQANKNLSCSHKKNRTAEFEILTMEKGIKDKVKAILGLKPPGKRKQPKSFPKAIQL